MENRAPAEHAGQGGEPSPCPKQNLDWVLEALVPLVPKTYERLKAKFLRFDQARCGLLTDQDVQQAYSTPTEEFPLVSARCLVRLFSPDGQINFNEFLYMDRFSIVVLSIYQRRMVGPALPFSALPVALSDMGITLPQPVCTGLTNSPLCRGPLSAEGYLTFVDFFAVSSFVVLALIRFQRWAKGGDTITLTSEKMVSAMLWFV